MNHEKKRILYLLVFFCVIFTVLIVYLNFFYFTKASSYKDLSYNRRKYKKEEMIQRGSVYDRDGELLAYSEKKDSSFQRKYSYPKTYSHLIGYDHREYGKAGLEDTYNNELLGLSESDLLNELQKLKENRQGNALRLSIKHSLQVFARETLRKEAGGSILAMNVKTGELYTMASYPDFNPSELTENWKEIVERSDAPLLNRATQGLYEPGSIFKIITSEALLDRIDTQEEYVSNGKEKVDGYVFRDVDREGYGALDLEKAFVLSSNTYFANRAQKITGRELGKSAEAFYVNRDIPFDLPVKKSRFEYDDLSKVELSASAIGQGEVLVTPMNMLIMTNIVANRGMLVEPRLVKAIVSPNGKERETLIQRRQTGISDQHLSKIAAMMKEVVDKGTGKKARLSKVSVAGKTGTAENGSGKTHAWFVGFAPYEDPEVAVCVLIEQSGSTGGQKAAPIAREILKQSLNLTEKELKGDRK